jgi:hypothetical protein
MINVLTQPYRLPSQPERDNFCTTMTYLPLCNSTQPDMTDRALLQSLRSVPGALHGGVGLGTASANKSHQ